MSRRPADEGRCGRGRGDLPEPAQAAARHRSLAVLSLGPEAGEEDIRAAYRRLALRYHPDSSGDASTAGRFVRVARAYKILEAIGPRAAGAPGIGPLGSGGSGSALRDAVLAGGRLAGPGEDLFSLGQALAAESDPRARAAAARRLGLSGRAAAYVFLRRALYDPDESVALAAVRAAALLGSRQAAGEVAALYNRASPALKRSLLEAAEATGERLFRETLASARGDPDPRLRALALGIATRAAQELSAAASG